ncbi:MAG: hypothetical protein ACKVOE_10550 [Rickettsiales bacterium]
MALGLGSLLSMGKSSAPERQPLMDLTRPMLPGGIGNILLESLSAVGDKVGNLIGSGFDSAGAGLGMLGDTISTTLGSISAHGSAATEIVPPKHGIGRSAEALSLQATMPENDFHTTVIAPVTPIQKFAQVGASVMMG